MKLTKQGIQITMPRFLKSFINSFTGKYCPYCLNKMAPVGYNDKKVECPNDCDRKKKLEKRGSKNK